MSEVRKKRILYNSNHSRILTGFGKNTKNVLSYLYKTNKYELFEYCAALNWSNPGLNYLPWEAHGALPDSQQEVNELNRDMGKARNANYGEYNIERAVREFKPDLCMFVEDSWGVTFNTSKSFWGKIPSVFWVTQDSIPLINTSDATKTPYYWCWSDFATEEMHRLGFKNVKTQYPLVDLTNFRILGDSEKAEIRRKHHIAPDTFIITMCSRNQLRKLFPNQIEAYAIFKKNHPSIKSILLFVTNFTEGWNIGNLAQQYGVPKEEIWGAYVSQHSNEYQLRFYDGNDLKCPWTGAEKALHTVNIQKGVSESQLNEIYNISDVISHPATSGACELPLVEAAAAGKIILTVDYSFGVDVTRYNKAAFTMDWSKYTEIGTQFVKASPQPFGISKLFKKIYDMEPAKRKELGLLSRQWAVDNYNLETNGKKIEDFIDTMPNLDWDKIDLSTKPIPKNDKYPFPSQINENTAFIQDLYNNILMMKEPLDGEGQKHWEMQLSRGMPKVDIYNFFIQTAAQENQKNQPQQDLWSAIDKNTGNKRALLLIKQSIGDSLVITQLFQSFHKIYPHYDLYVMSDRSYAEVFEGNPLVYKWLPYVPQAENELLMTGAGQEEGYFHVYLHPAILTQRHLDYLSIDKIAYPLNLSSK